MAVDLSINIFLQYFKEPSDGSHCFFCGDIAWLNHWRLYLKVCGEPFQPHNVILCDSCYDLVRIKENVN